MLHPASFRRFLQERLTPKTGITNYHLLDGNTEVRQRRSGAQAKPWSLRPSILPSLVLVRTAISRLMIRPLISRPKSLT